ncbi:MAG: NADH-quinone oxidoreductase subunit NuoN [Gammaproteobacteria bacterium]|jgi:NADH-quinone oxidoreductase subunit N|nr:NADH-quinone oxidoreductase subunit NuoN [Gammaproteobacteria bacterium]NCF81417.1 NADH-quinone oxidoreductase subunit NuoN [Pseudomonadota bacterium]
MNFVVPDMSVAAPEMFLLAATCAVLVIDVYLPERLRLLTYHLAQASLVITAGLCLVMFPESPQVSFNGTFISDTMSVLLKVFILLTTYFVFFYSKIYLRAWQLFRGEYFVLGLFAVLGMMVLVSAHSLLTVYLGLELLSLSLYAMVAMNRESSTASEAAMKYFVLGALASGMLLYGMSMIYGATGSLDLGAIREHVATLESRNLVLVLGLVFVIVGIAFKLGAVPFHMWVPDVYQGAPTSVTLFIGSAPKIAAFGMLVRLLVDGLPGMHADWIGMLIILSVLSMGVGNIIAIAQTNLKRMLAYSTIAHVGFLFLGIIAGSKAGYSASMFYIIVYAFMSLGGFAMIVLLGHGGFEADRIEDFKGLNDRNPWYAFLMLILMMSMAGVPPFLGFWAKWSVLREVVAADMTWLAVVAVIFSIIGVFYYLRVIRMMYFEKAQAAEPVVAGSEMRVMVSANALAILALGIYPSGLLALCISAFGG